MKRFAQFLDEAVNHPFAHFGPGPYKYLGANKNWFTAFPGDPGKPGGTCDHCGTGIAYEFWFQAANGRKFKVGSECALKADTKDVHSDDMMHGRKTLTDIVKQEQKKITKANKQQKWDTWTAEVLPQVEHILRKQPHPHRQYNPALKEKSLYDHVVDLLKFPGNTRATEIINTALGKKTKYNYDYLFPNGKK